MSSFYTNFFISGNTVHLRRIDDGIRSMQTFQASPTLYITDQNADGSMKSLYGEPVSPIDFQTVQEAKDFIDQYKGMRMPVYGFPRFEYTEIDKIFPGADGIDFRFDLLNVAIIDIETMVENGKFPEPDDAEEEVSLISLSMNGHCYVFSKWDEGCDFPNTTFVYCRDEETLLNKFLTQWKQNYPDIISGWNNKFFDMPYLYNRMNKIIGETKTKQLSPFKRVTVGEEMGKFGGSKTVINIKGIATLDYLDLYQKFTYSVQESYKLDFIAEAELGRKKLENPYDSFREHYMKDPKGFVMYNRIDVDLVEALEKKMRLIELACTVAYSSKVNYEDVFKNIRVWDVIVGNYLSSINLQGDAYFDRVDAEPFEGAYVKDPLKGMYKWIVGFDLESLYPSIMIQQNMSPETFISRTYKLTSRDVLEKTNTYLEALEEAKQNNATLCSNGAMFDQKVEGIIPFLVDRGFRMRKEAKKIMIAKQQQLELVRAELQRRKK